jgi:hypothetical protein
MILGCEHSFGTPHASEVGDVDRASVGVDAERDLHCPLRLAVASIAPNEIRGSAFRAARRDSVVREPGRERAGRVLWMLASPRLAFLYLAAWMLVSLVAFARMR